MKSFLVSLLVIAAVATAEKYAIVFGAAHGWSNYPVYSVLEYDTLSLLVNLSYG